ncbi:MAG: hypothetical protein ACNFW9_04445 [Candidatus Kerfeldbacteria bacterium]|jgi:hypothetical protein
MKDLEKAIIDTVAYFDIFDYPLTDMEIWKWLVFNNDEIKSVSLFDVKSILSDSDYLQSKIEFSQGHYFFRGRKDIINIRRQRYSLAEKKYRRALNVIKILRFAPFVKMVAICNTLAFSNSRDESDIDLFIVTKRNRVWQSRFWVAGFLKLFKMRPSNNKSKDTICSSFFVDEDHLNLEKFSIKNDIYLLYWITQIIPVYNYDIYDKFVSANTWTKKILPNTLQINPVKKRSLSKVKLFKVIIDFVLTFFPEKIFKNYQLKIMPANLSKLANKDTRVVVNDNVLKFHDNDRREIFLQKWETRKSEII